MTRVGPVLIVAVVCAVSGTMIPLGVQAQSEESRPAQTLDTLESLLGWPTPDPEAVTDVRVMTRSALSVAPLPLLRITGGEDNHVTASVTEWGAPDTEPGDSRPLFFKYLPLTCADDRSICAGTPRVIRSPEVKALWFALFIARSCNDRPRKSVSDAEDLFVRGRVGGVPMTYSCRGPNPRGASPGDRQAAAVLRMSRRLVSR